MEIFNLFVITQFSNSCKYACCRLAAVSCLEFCVRIVRLSLYDNMCVFGSVCVGT